MIETPATGIVAGPTPVARRDWSPTALLIPGTTIIPRRARLTVQAAFLMLIAIVIANGLHVLFGLAPSWETAMRGPVVALANVVAAVIVGVRASIERDRKPVWILLAAGFGCYALAFVLWSGQLEFNLLGSHWVIADVVWGLIYPLLGGALVVASRWYMPSGGLSPKMWLDALLAASAILALGAAFVAPPLIRAAHQSHEAAVINMLFPAADLVVGVLMLTLLGIRGWIIDRKWITAITAFSFWMAADCACSLQGLNGASTGDSTATLLYMVAFLFVAATAWQPEVNPATSESTHWSTLVVPGAFMLVAPIVLVTDHFSRVSLLALVITWIALLVAIARISLALRDTLSFRDMQRAALTDELTGLPNRRMFFTRLAEQLEIVERERGTLTAMMLDLDNFKQLNDTLGHAAGDELLRMIGPRLERVARNDDTIARLGGDEFAILLDTGSEGLAGTRLAQAVVDSFSEPFQVHGLTLRLTASIGIASYPHDANGPETLLKCADVAMYDAKRSRRGFEHYSPERDLYTRERLELSGELSVALDGEEIEALYQPIVDSHSRLIVGAEALARWRREDGSLRPPAEFLEAAELAGLSRPLTRRMLKLALGQVREWRLGGHRLYVSVNVTVADLLDESFPTELADLLEAHGVEPEGLTIEVTESSIVANPARIGSVIRRIRGLGVEVALDDFGTGYSSLTHLRQLPVDAVKIDSSFVTNMCDETTDAAIVYATIELAHRLNLQVISEGVEDERTWQALLELGSERIQGYAMSRPIEPEAFRALLESAGSVHFADSQSVPTPASTASGGSIA